MLEVKKCNGGVYITNGKKTVWVSEYTLNNLAVVSVLDDNGTSAGEVVYTYHDPIKVGNDYGAPYLMQNAADQTIIVNRQGCSYQLLGGSWRSAASCITMDYLPGGTYTVVWVPQEDIPF